MPLNANPIGVKRDAVAIPPIVFLHAQQGQPQGRDVRARPVGDLISLRDFGRATPGS